MPEWYGRDLGGVPPLTFFGYEYMTVEQQMELSVWHAGERARGPSLLY